MEDKKNSGGFTANDFLERKTDNNGTGVKRDEDDLTLETPFGSLDKGDAFNRGKEDGGEEDSGSPFSGNAKKCPGCGANLIYDTDAKALICRSCGNVYDPQTMEMNGSLGIENPEQEYTPDDTLDYDDQSRKEIVCNSCGSQIIADANTAATICPFCGSPTLVTRRLTRQFRPDAIMPFKITKENAKSRFKDFVSGAGDVPKKFRENATIDKITGIYVPFWLLSADVKMDIGGWGHTIIDGSSHYDELKNENGHYHSMDFPIDGTVEFSLQNVPFDGSHKIGDKLMEAIEPFDYSELVPYNASYLQGFLAEKYDTQPKDMYDRIRRRLDDYCHSIAENVDFEGFDAFTYNSSYTEITYKNYRIIYCLLPVWFLTVRYDDRDWQFAVNGQTGEVCGSLPYSRISTVMSDVSSKFCNFKFTSVGAWLYVAFPVIIVLAAAFLAAYYEDSHPLVVMLGYIIATAVAVIAYASPWILRKRQKRREMAMENKKDPHILDKAPHVSFYFDTSRKLRATKKFVQGAENGIAMPSVESRMENSHRKNSAVINMKYKELRGM